MGYRFEAGQIYRMPTHFGPVPGPRQMPAEAVADPIGTPHRLIVSASFRTDAAALARHMPPGFELTGEPEVTIEFQYLTGVDWLAGRGYAMAQVLWPVRYRGSRDRADGQLLAVVWENLPDAIISGREEIGHPKLYAEIPDPRVYQGGYHCTAEWMGFRFLELEVTGLREGIPDRLQAPARDGTLMLKYLPRTSAWGEADTCQVTLTPAAGRGVTIDRCESGDGRVGFRRATWEDLPTTYHVVNALAELPILELTGGSVMLAHGGKPYLDQRVLV
jgi:hypothetical protein